MYGGSEAWFRGEVSPGSWRDAPTRMNKRITEATHLRRVGVSAWKDLLLARAPLKSALRLDERLYLCRSLQRRAQGRGREGINCLPFVARVCSSENSGARCTRMQGVS